ncbi:C-type lectin domain family 4 member E-like isoform X3 [Rhinatrema bivittatum]|uniref:C-type lectin domain family 4 member E-like isoform X3 n=1 Tax=Rhinatrema bivittatum TaxID=194408 RepID=UPI00112B6499|nr:C-type lectin domain family 4 member E-like isoform X3 [Rhinatrema bivittatum]
MAFEKPYQELQLQDQHVYADLHEAPANTLGEAANKGNYQNLQLQDQQGTLQDQQSARDERRTRKGHVNSSCLSNDTSLSGLQQLKASVCASPGHVCEYCPMNWHFHAGKCYFFQVVHLDWPSSKEACEQKGAHLTVIDTKEEEVFVEERVPSAAWLGLARNERRIWTWVDGTTLANENTFWSTNMTANSNGAEDCVSIFRRTVTQRGWLTDACYRKKPSICEWGAGLYAG